MNARYRYGVRIGDRTWEDEGPAPWWVTLLLSAAAAVAAAISVVPWLIGVMWLVGVLR